MGLCATPNTNSRRTHSRFMERGTVTGRVRWKSDGHWLNIVIPSDCLAHNERARVRVREGDRVSALRSDLEGSQAWTCSARLRDSEGEDQVTTVLPMLPPKNARVPAATMTTSTIATTTGPALMVGATQLILFTLDVLSFLRRAGQHPESGRFGASISRTASAFVRDHVQVLGERRILKMSSRA